MSLNNNLRHLIKDKQIKIKEVSAKTGVDRATIHRLITKENENPRIKTVMALAIYFNMSIDELLK